MRSHSPRNEKPLHWMGSSKRDLLEFPDEVVDNIGYALGVVQYGGHPPSRQGRTTRRAMARKRTEIEAGTGNVFADLGYPDAKERSLKVELAMEVNRLLQERGLAQDRAARLLGIRQPHVSDLVRYRLNRFSVERLMDFLTRLGRDVEIRIAPRPSGRRRSAVQVRLA